MAFPERVETPRLTLRRLAAADADALEAVWGDPDVWPVLRPGVPFDPGFARSCVEHRLEHWGEHGFGLWVIDRDGEIAGCIGPSHPTFVPELANEVELGWTLRRVFWGHGYATEAASAALTRSLTRSTRRARSA